MAEGPDPADVAAIDLAEGEMVDPGAFKALIRAAAADQAKQREGK